VYARRDDAGGEPDGSSTAAGELRDYVRSHPVRVGILALLAQRERSAEDLCTELPTKPSPAVLDYHLKTLCTAGMVDARDRGGVSVFQLI
jgi:DNA-binding transcriptional ArsR family regulator